MTSLRSAPENRRLHGMRAIRLASVLLASLLLHLIALEWAGGRLALPSMHQEKESVITTELLPPPRKKPMATPRPAPVIAHRHKARPKPRPTPKPRPKPAALPAPAPPAAPAPVPAATPAANPAPPPAASAADGTGTAVTAAAAAAPSTTTAPQQPPKPAHEFDPPPSAELRYDVFALRESEEWYGSGKFTWNAADGHYSVNGEASITFFFKITVLNFHSDGAIDGYGIEPRLYSEEPFRKPVSSTHFRHQPEARDGTIDFSASKATFPYHDGAQDRASVMWQLAGIGRGDPGQFTPGASIDLLVAGTHDVETWQMVVAGLEQIETDYGKMRAWHVVRAPRPGSGEQKIDIWLAPQHEWYPAKVRYTYANGDYLELTLTDLTPVGTQPATARAVQ